SERSVRFGLDDEDRGHPIVSRRLAASKLATLGELIATTKNDALKTKSALVRAFSTPAVGYLEEGAKRIAVIVNRVAVARHIHAELQTRVDNAADVVLLTGRMRPLDRSEIFGDVDDPTSVARR